MVHVGVVLNATFIFCGLGGSGGRLGNKMFGVASMLGIAKHNGFLRYGSTFGATSPFAESLEVDAVDHCSCEPTRNEDGSSGPVHGKFLKAKSSAPERCLCVDKYGDSRQVTWLYYHHLTFPRAPPPVLAHCPLTGLPSSKACHPSLHPNSRWGLVTFASTGTGSHTNISLALHVKQ
jgi:hypothetical protein